MDIDALLLKINEVIVNPLIGLLFVVATVVFLYGLIRYFISGSEQEREIGKRHLLWGLTGMFIMISVFGIMRIIVNTFDIDLSEVGVDIPM